MKQPITKWPAEPSQASRRPGINEREIQRFVKNKPYIELEAAHRFVIECSVATMNFQTSACLLFPPLKTLLMDGFVKYQYL